MGEIGYADFGRGCYDEFNPAIRNIRNLCSLNCRDADEVTVLSKTPSNNHKCNQYYSYGISHSGPEAYLWRTDGCLNETVEFEIRCGFPFELSEFVSASESLFTLL